MSKILIVEDDQELCGCLREYLCKEGYTVDTAHDGQTGSHMLKHYPYDLIVLDWELPSLSGIELCKMFRSARGQTPILMLTGRSELSDKEKGLDSGADDYLTKPFEERELAARVRALLRRSVIFSPQVLQIGDLMLDSHSGQVTLGGKEIHLLRKELALLEFLMKHPNQLFSADALLERLWSSESETTANSVRTFMYTLRKKVSPKGSRQWIETVHGSGYKFVP